MFLVELIVSSFLDLISKRARRNAAVTVFLLYVICFPRGGGGGYSHTLPIRVCAAQRGRDFEAPDLERGIDFRGVF